MRVYFARAIFIFFVSLPLSPFYYFRRIWHSDAVKKFLPRAYSIEFFEPLKTTANKNPKINATHISGVFYWIVVHTALPLKGDISCGFDRSLGLFWTVPILEMDSGRFSDRTTYYAMWISLWCDFVFENLTIDYHPCSPLLHRWVCGKLKTYIHGSITPKVKVLTSFHNSSNSN